MHNFIYNFPKDYAIQFAIKIIVLKSRAVGLISHSSHDVKLIGSTITLLSTTQASSSPLDPHPVQLPPDEHDRGRDRNRAVRDPGRLHGVHDAGMEDGQEPLPGNGVHSNDTG